MAKPLDVDPRLARHLVQRDQAPARRTNTISRVIRMKETTMIVLVAKYHVKAGNGDAVAAALKQMAPLVKAGEPGCTLYHANRSTENPDLFLLYEHYTDEAAFLGH